MSSSRLRDLQAFDDTKAGVKGLVDAGVTTIPAIFHHQSDPIPHHVDAIPIPLIDLADVDRGHLVAQVRAGAQSVGFFQVLNHGVPAELLDDMLAAVRRFNEQAAEGKRPFYSRDRGRRVKFNSNFDLFQSPAANWRDTLLLDMAPPGPPPEEIPPECRAVVPEYARAMQGLGVALLELLSEALGLPARYLAQDAGGLDGMSMAAHYYPPCPEPHLTLGTTRHSDPSFLTVVLQDASSKGVGGLQVLLGAGRWVDVPPVAGALVVNIGDLLQLVSNERFRSVEHRVVATTSDRLSVAFFFRPHSACTRVYGPVGAGADAVYRSTTMPEFLAHYVGKGLDGRSALDHFRLPPPPHS
ncbi:DIBOA-glucoside dioxygenase BX6-like [Oryza brachyantha]|uniref:Fe2OG dioxygenase domain-containing protein n=1 Tax=Oryza brachyantha TaxID=4533 RepID=J3LV11_ORYBR|nr:DIBOA-glucoside dioxygenase BX6-like [Oryza brachyantha]